MRLTIVYICVFLCCITNGWSQKNEDLSFFEPADTFHSKRFNTALIVGGATYAGFSYALYKTWYSDYPQQSFHFFNDWNEWSNMDKAGHVYSAYFQSRLCYTGGKWTGLKEDDAILTGIICGTLFQSTIEVMDGFSTQWGFSIPDFTANLIGVASFATQQKLWKDQKIVLKVSSTPVDYSKNPIISQSGSASSTLNKRANDLFGPSFYERFLKDYNAQTVWASFNIESFTKGDTWVPDWLNVAVGYGAENMLGGFTNSWQEGMESYLLSDDTLPRYQQYYLSLDVDLTRIKTDNFFFKTILSMLNIFKLPAPALEVTSQGGVIFHFLRF